MRRAVALVLLLLLAVASWLALRGEDEVAPDGAPNEVEVDAPDDLPAERARVSRATRAEERAGGPTAVPDVTSPNLIPDVPGGIEVTVKDGDILAASATVELHRFQVTDLLLSSPIDTAMANLSGVARFEDVKRGMYRIHARLGNRASFAVPLHVAPGELRKTTLQIDAADLLQGRVIDASGAAIAGAIVELKLAFTDRRSVSRTGFTDGGGNFVVHRMPLESLQSVRVVANHDDWPRVEMTFDPDVARSSDGLRIVLAEQKIVGRCVTESETPILDAHISLGLRDPTGLAHTDAAGEFEIATEDRRPTALVFRADGMGTKLVPIETDSASIDLGDVVLTKGHVLRGRVIDENGGPVSGAKAYLRSGLRGWVLAAVDVDADGWFEFESVAESEHTVVIGPASGIGGETWEASGVRGGRGDDLRILASAQLRQVVMLSAEAAARNITIETYLSGDTELVATTEVREVGARAMTGVTLQFPERATYDVRIRADGFEPLDLEITVGSSFELHQAKLLESD